MARHRRSPELGPLASDRSFLFTSTLDWFARAGSAFKFSLRNEVEYGPGCGKGAVPTAHGLPSLFEELTL